MAGRCYNGAGFRPAETEKERAQAMRDLLQMLLFGLIPPELPLATNGPPSAEETMTYRKAKRRWYRAVAVGLWSLIIAFGLSFSWAVGWFPRTSGLAFAEDMQKAATDVTDKISGLEQAVAAIAYDQLVSRLMVNRKLQCEAIEADDDSRKATYATIMQELKVRHLKTQGVAWDQPACDSL